jgi:hypothetical protein
LTATTQFAKIEVLEIKPNNHMDYDELTAEEYRTPKHEAQEMTTYEIAEKEKWEDYYREAKLEII